MFLLKQENVQPHTAQEDQNDLMEVATNTSMASTESNINPIEYIWNILGKLLKDHLSHPNNLEEAHFWKYGMN